MSVALRISHQVAVNKDALISTEYLQSLRLIERLHRLLLDVIKDEFDRLGGSEITPVQALLIYNIGNTELSAGELKSRGYYLGSNVSYNIKRLVDASYVHHKRSDTDRRSVRISLTDKGRASCEVVRQLFHRQVGDIEQVGKITRVDLGSLIKALTRLERYWSDQIRYRM